MLASSRWMGLVALLAFKKTISLTHHAFSQTSPPPAANQAAFLCSFPVLWQLSPAALDFTHQNLYNKIKYYRFCGKEVRSWISPANTASIPCAYRAAIPPATANPARFPLCRAPLSNMIAPTIWASCLTCRPAVIFIPACKTPPAIPSPPRLPNWRAAPPVC